MADSIMKKNRVLYIRRENKFKRVLENFRRWLPDVNFSGQDGFFRASLHSAFNVTEKPLDYLYLNRNNVHKKYDWIVLNYKADSRGTGFEKDSKIIRLIKDIAHCGKALFINFARAGVLPPEPLLDEFDVIFKREVLKDKDQYKISNNNKRKLKTTMLSCPLVPAALWNYRRLNIEKYGYNDPPASPVQDAMFIGSDSNPLRTSVIEHLNNSGLHFLGGLYGKKTKMIRRQEYYLSRLPIPEYIRQVRNTKVNLALEGKGEFTFRHLELWCLCSFMLSSPSIRGVELPIDAEEGKHYLCFDDHGDLLDKAAYFAKNETERNHIAKRGRAMFVRDYNFNKHGEYIASFLS